jgi:hypothetical protein
MIRLTDEQWERIRDIMWLLQLLKPLTYSPSWRA